MAHKQGDASAALWFKRSVCNQQRVEFHFKIIHFSRVRKPTLNNSLANNYLLLRKRKSAFVINGIYSVNNVSLYIAAVRSFCG